MPSSRRKLRRLSIALGATVLAGGCFPPPSEKALVGAKTGSAAAAPKQSPASATAAPAVLPVQATVAAPLVAPPTAVAAAMGAEPPAAVATAAGGWPVLAPPDEGFRLELPAVPDPQSGEVDTPAGKVFIRFYSLADDERKRVYSIAVNRLPAAPPPTEADKVLDRARDGSVKLVVGQLLRETKEPHDGRPGRSLLLSLGDGAFVHARFVLAGPRLFQVSIVSNSDVLSADDRRVFDSLSIGDAPVVAVRGAPWRFITPQNSTFAVEMPGDPREESGLLNTPLGRVDLRRLELTVGGRTYFAQSCDVPSAAAATTAEKLDAARDHIVRETRGRVVGETPEKLLGSEGREVAVEYGSRTMRARTFIDGPRVYQIGIVADTATAATTPDDARFFASFRLSEPDVAVPTHVRP